MQIELYIYSYYEHVQMHLNAESSTFSTPRQKRNKEEKRNPNIGPIVWQRTISKANKKVFHVFFLL